MELLNQETMLYVIAAGWFFDNVLAHVPAIKSNSTFQLLCNLVDSAVSAAKRK
jgi:hypothetical protein